VECWKETCSGFAGAARLYFTALLTPALGPKRFGPIARDAWGSSGGASIAGRQPRRNHDLKARWNVRYRRAPIFARGSLVAHQSHLPPGPKRCAPPIVSPRLGFLP